MNSAEARELLSSRYGVRRVPVVARGDRYVFAHILDTVAAFVGSAGSSAGILSPAELMSRWLRILEASRANVSQLPDGALRENATANRKRATRILAQHIFNIVNSYVDCLETGAPSLSDLTNREPDEDTLTSTAELVAYADEALERIGRWWRDCVDKSLSGLSPAQDYGTGFTLHRMLEFSVAHSTQHCRQLAAVLERLGIEPLGKIAPEDLRGLPLAAGIWE